MFKTAGPRGASLPGMIALAILLVGQALAVMDGSILVVAAPSLRANLHASSAELQLVVAVYTLAFGALVITGARLGDIVGRQRAFVLGLAAFSLASLVGGLAPTPAVLIFARALQGAAAALMTPQVLSIIQTQFAGESRARAIGAYSMILAVGVAAGQVLGGLLVSAHLLAAAWRPALLLNAPVGAVVLAASRRGLPRMAPGGASRLDFPGIALLSSALLALIVPLTFGRDYHWPAWVWPCLATSAAAGGAFLRRERRLSAGAGRGGAHRGGAHPLLDVRLFMLPGVAAGIGAILLIMASYAGFLLSLTLHLQDGLRFSPLHAGLTFAVYASGFAAASLTWTRAGATLRARLPVIGPLLMAAALLTIGVIAAGGRWPLATAPLLLAAGVGHALGFSPLASRLTTAIQPSQAADLSGVILTASLIGQVIGVAAFVGIYLTAGSHGSSHGLAVTTAVLAAALIVTAACAGRALASRRASVASR